MNVYERIIRMARGRIHPLVGYDPLRDVHIGDTRFLDAARRSVEAGGFLGVKLYPPMGFAPTGNAARACGNNVGYQPSGVRWRSLAAQSGTAIDARLDQLYRWASEKGVPIMAHCNDSNYARADCAAGDRNRQQATDLGSPQQWAEVLAKYPTLRLNLSHFGGPFQLPDTEGNRAASRPALSPWALEIIKLMEKYPNVYSDLSYAEELLSGRHAEACAAVLRDAIGANPSLAARLMYGSDWFMLVNEDDYRTFIEAIRRAVPPSAADAVVGGNAVRFLGLRRGDPARARLDAYYKETGIPGPVWQSLVDGGT